MNVAVFGASGKTGRAVAAALRGAGESPIRLGRSAWSDLPGSLVGCDVLYLLAPNMHHDEPAYVSKILDAALLSGVRRVVYHSVAAPYAPAMPHHLAKARSEDLVRRSGLGWTILQPCAYLQNFLPALAGPDPIVRVPYDVDRPFGLVDLVDVGIAAAAVVRDVSHVGATYELGGPSLVSVRDVAEAAGILLRRPVPVERVETFAWMGGPGANLEQRVREWLLSMFAYYDQYGLPTGHVALAAILGRSPTTIAQALARDLPHSMLLD